MTIVTSFSAVSKPMSGREMSLSTTHVQALALELAARRLRALAVLGREADEGLPGAARGAQRGQDVVGALELELEAVGVLLDLRPRDVGRAVVGHGGGHQQQVAVAEALRGRPRPARPPSRRRRRSRPGCGPARRWRPRRSRSAPRRAASSASAKPIRPEERLPT